MIKLIIFDRDDVFTLGATKWYFTCYQETIKELWVHLSADEQKKRILENRWKSHEVELQGLLKEYPDLLEEACEIYESKLFGNTFIDQLELVPWSNDFLKRISSNYILSISTGLHRKMLLERVMPKFEIPKVFSQIVCTSDITDIDKQKPSPYSIKKILEDQHIKPDEAIVVGDAEWDVMMALGAHVTPVVVLTWNLTQSRAQELGVKYIMDDVTQLEDLLNTQFTESR